MQTSILAFGATLLIAGATLAPLRAQHPASHAAQPDRPDVAISSSVATAAPTPPHPMWMRPLGGGWHLMGMAQVFPTVTTASPWREQTVLRGGAYATQPAFMVNVASPDARVVLRTTLNLEAWTQPEGELTLGGWGEGFIDSRHPHTLLHEAMLTANLWNVSGGALSISAGKGFAPYGTDDPMGRPAVKFPTNHHLSQVLERWTVNAAYLAGGWSLEAGVFSGAEPSGPYDFSNIEHFGDSWSGRLAWRSGSGAEHDAAWEVSGSFAYIEEAHHGVTSINQLYNASVRHAGVSPFGTTYGMIEASASDPRSGTGYHSVLGEGQLGFGPDARHRPYARVEYATRPEYDREGVPGTPGFFRYDHDDHAIGATRWLISTVGYGYESSLYPRSVRPYLEVQHNRVATERGSVDPGALYGARDFWSLSVGARVFFGGGPMRMGSYGSLDPMTAAMRPSAGTAKLGAHGSH